MNIFDEIIEIERNGRLFKLSALRRYDPFTIAIIATAAGTGLQVASTIKQGKDAEQIAEARADIDEQNAQAVREASVEKARIQGERGKQLLARQKGAAAAGNIRINVGSPLVIETETRRNIAKDIGFGLESGRVESESLLQTAELERTIGKKKRKASKFDALITGIGGIASIANMGKRLPGIPGTGPNLPRVGTVSSQTGAALARF